MPQRLETYQKQVMAQRLNEYRRLIRASFPKRYQTLITQTLNSFKLDKVSEAEAMLTSAKSLSAFQKAMFEAHKASRRELEAIAESLMISEVLARKVDVKVLTAWTNTCKAINKRAFQAGDELAGRTREVSNTIHFAKDPTKITKAWNNYIQTIQSEFPEIAQSLQVIATPDTDTLWSAYRAIQERRWFNVGQEKLTAMGIDFNEFPRVIGASGKLLTQEDFLKAQLDALTKWEGRVTTTFNKRHIKPTAKNKLLDGLRAETIQTKESIALQMQQIEHQAMDLAQNTTYATFGNYARRTNLDDFMLSIGMPFWFFPSRSIPFYITQSMQKPQLGIQIARMQQEIHESEQPARLFGSINIPGTDYYYNPIWSLMLWQLANPQSFTPANIGGIEEVQNWMSNNLAISLGPQWRIGAALVERALTRGTNLQPQPIIPQQRWIAAVAGLELPVVSHVAALINEPFDAYLRAVYGDDVAEWQQREVEKTIVDMGYNPRTASKEIIKAAWDKYYTRQLLSIPGGAVRVMTPTEKARFEAINEKAEELGLTREQRATLRKLGESPFTGLRQDQLEAIYADIPAQKLWRYIRPYGLTPESKPIWEDYIQLKLEREELLYGTDRDNPSEGSRLYREQQIDKALLRSRNPITPREWKSLYRSSYETYSSQIKGLERAHPLAPKTDADWEAYRKMLGWDEPVRHPDDVKLDEYYKAMDSSLFTDDKGEFDFDAYRKAEAAFFSNLSPETIAYIQARKDRYKTPLRAAYNRDMEIVQPYYEIQDAILSQYPPHVAMIVEQALAAPDAVIQKAILVQSPEAMLALRRVREAKEYMRRVNPELDHILRYWNR